jgi:hypothetical protein
MVILCGRDIYLDPWGTKAGRTEYDRVISEWIHNGRGTLSGASDVAVVEIFNAYLKFADAYYVKDDHRT